MVSFPFSSTSGTKDRAITSEMERNFYKQIYTNGVLMNVSSALQVVAKSGMTINVNPGACIIEGANGIEANKRSFTLEAANSSLPRIDRVVARMNLATSYRSVELYVKTGSTATTPEAPSLTRESNYYEIALADIRVAAGATEITQSVITDQRLNTAVCGAVVPAFPTSIDTESIFNQFQAALDEYMTLVQSAIDETTAGNLQTEIRSMIYIYKDLTLDLTKAVTDSTYAEYPYHVDLTLSGCTSDHIPLVHLATPTGLISSVCQTFNGYIRFYTTTNKGSIAIPSIDLTRGGN